MVPGHQPAAAICRPARRARGACGHPCQNGGVSNNGDERGALRSGELLVASTSMDDGVFRQSVIYLLDVEENGSVGVVLNQRSPTELGEVLPQWEDLVSPPRALFAGGPVSPHGAVCVAQLADEREDPPGWRRVLGDLGLLHLDTPTEIAEGAYRNLRIFAGYTGWEAGQLEAEVLHGCWHVVAARDADIFGAHQEDLWRRVLRRQGGELGLWSTWPDDPDQN